jgi:PTS system nitrogen regulatory IIA component
MDLHKLFTEHIEVAELSAENKFQVIEDLVHLLQKAAGVQNEETALNDVIEREKYLSTGLENGIAIPHGKTTAVEQLMVAFGRSKNGVDFDSLDGKPSHLIFLVLSPKDQSGPHIQLLAKISRNLKQDKVRKALLNAPDEAAIRGVFAEFE